MPALTNLKSGEMGEITAIADDVRFRHHKKRHLLVSMGFQKGKRIQVILNDFSRPLLIQVDETQVVIGRSIADLIHVRRCLI